MYSVCDDLKGRVSPFGHLRIKARLPAPRSFSQATTSFIACNRQGIHHVHLFTCPYNVDLSEERTLQSKRQCLCVQLYYYPKNAPFGTLLKKTYFFQIFKEQNNRDLEKIKLKFTSYLDNLRLNFGGG